MKIFRRLIIPFIMIFFIALIIFALWNSSRTIYNPQGTTGNTPGNLLNGGLFCEYKDKIYFSNYKDDGALYTMDINNTNFSKIQTDKAFYLNIAGDYIYYSRMNNTKKDNKGSFLIFKNVGLYRVTLDGGNLKSLYDGATGLLNLYSNTIYYQHYNSDDGLTFFKVNIDGKDSKKISDEAIMPISIANSTLYYSKVDDNHNITSMNLDTGFSSTISKEQSYAPIYNNGFLYFLSLSNNYEIYKTDAKGNDLEAIVTSRCSTYNITEDGKFLYYQIDDTKNNGIHYVNLLTGETTDLMDGDFKEINIAGDNVYFTDFNETNWYYSPIGSTKVNIFNPSVIDK